MEIGGIAINPWIIILVVFLVWVIILKIVKRAVFATIQRFTEKTENKIDDVLIDALNFPLNLLVYASGVLVAQNFIPKDANIEVVKYFGYGFKIVAIIAVILFVDKFLRGLIDLYAEKVEVLKTAGGVAQGVTRLLVLGLGGMILLDTLGVSITPIIASLGIGSLAVALALQPTLENFFAGVQILADKPIQVGQFIKLESGEEGTVKKIGWRSTWVCQPNNNTVVIPNKLLVNTRVLNYFLPDTEMIVPISVGVHYDSDLDKVERVALDVARETLKDVPGAVRSFDPVVRFHAFSESSIDFQVILRVQEWAAAGLVKHEFIKRLQKRFTQEQIVIPYPTRTIVQEKA